MLLVADIGNTSITYGRYTQGQLHSTHRVASTGAINSAHLQQELRAWLTETGAAAQTIRGALVCSVVPRLTSMVTQTLTAISGIPTRVVGEDVMVPITNRYDDPSQVGQDRLVNAFSGWSRYGGPIFIVDFGTAITIDVVTSDQQYLGGVIVPGVEISLEALSQRAALLPRVQLERPTTVLGRSTSHSIQSGIVFGFSELCDGLIERLAQECGDPMTVVATGGYADIITSHCRRIDCIDPHLTLDGLNLLWDHASDV